MAGKQPAEERGGDNSAKAATPAKRGPGRPPKRQPPPPLLKAGVVLDPSEADNLFEMVHDAPGMFKNLFTYYKNLKARDIYLRCTPNGDPFVGLAFFTRDNTRGIRVVAAIPGAALNHYYCETEFTVGLKREEFEKIFSSIDKSFFKITLLHRHDDPENLTIIFKDAEIDKDCNYKVAVTRLDPDEELFAAEVEMAPAALEAFPVEFTLSSRQFKKTIVDAAAQSTGLTIEKIYDHPLQLSFNSVGLSYREVYRNSEKIALRHSIGADEVFQCPVQLSQVKSFASAMVADTVQIFCREGADMLFRSNIEALTLCTFIGAA
jgi:hypothetical protein